jgi:hypothetical protein
MRQFSCFSLLGITLALVVGTASARAATVTLTGREAVELMSILAANGVVEVKPGPDTPKNVKPNAVLDKAWDGKSCADKSWPKNNFGLVSGTSFCGNSNVFPDNHCVLRDPSTNGKGVTKNVIGEKAYRMLSLLKQAGVPSKAGQGFPGAVEYHYTHILCTFAAGPTCANAQLPSCVIAL